MPHNLFKELKNWFDEYVSGFQYPDREDQKQIDLKYHHSYRVLNEITDLSKSLNLPRRQVTIAKIIGLFHDIGRFEQYDRYQTFSDARSLDHAELGVEIMVDNNLLSELDEVDKDRIYRAIKYHNKIEIPEASFREDKTGLTYARLIRDADKLDIWNIFARHYSSNDDNNKLTHSLSPDGGITPEVYERMKKGEVIKYRTLKTRDDMKLMQMGWVYDLNFRASLARVKKRGYIDQIYRSMSPSPEADDIYQQIIDYLNHI